MRGLLDGNDGLRDENRRLRSENERLNGRAKELELDPDPDTHYPILVAAKEPARQRTAAAPGDTPTSNTSSPTPATNNTKRCSSGSASTRAANSNLLPSPPAPYDIEYELALSGASR